MIQVNLVHQIVWNHYRFAFSYLRHGNRSSVLQSNVRVFSTLEEAMDPSCLYPDHTYVHIVNRYGCLEGVFIRVNGKLVSLRLELEV